MFCQIGEWVSYLYFSGWCTKQLQIPSTSLSSAHLNWLVDANKITKHHKVETSCQYTLFNFFRLCQIKIKEGSNI